MEIPGYTLMRPLGRGGMGEVYLAVQQSLGREVALKLLSPALSQDRAASERFVREARIAANLHHPHIVPIHDVGVHQGTAYIAMEFEPGGTVAALAREQLEPATALHITRDIASALDYAHHQGVVHRDVKPENILRRADGLCLLSDFGIARAIEAQTILTHEGASVGTPHYMSPEQLRGQQIDGRSDLYSLGVVLYQLLTGTLPYAASDSWALGMQHINEPIPRLPAALVHLQPLIDGLMAKEPGARPQAGAEVVSRIDALLAGATPALTRSMEIATPRPARRRAWLIGAVGVVLALGAGLWWRSQQGPSLDQRSAAPPPASAPGHGAATTPPAAADASIAVLPFVNMSEDKANEYFSDGLSEELLNTLCQAGSLRVIARTSSFSFKGTNTDIATIAQKLGVANVLEGSVRKAGNKVRITAQLIRARDSSHLWSQTYDRDLTDIFAVQEEIAAAVAEGLKVTLAGAAQPRREEGGTRNSDAYESYLAGRYLLNKGPLENNLREALVALDRALALDSKFALAHAARAEAWVSLSSFGYLDDYAAGYEQARRAAEQAVALAPDLADAHRMLGNVLANADHDWAGALTEVEKALALNPGSAAAQQNYAFTQMQRGHYDPGIAAARRASELDPLSLNVLLNLANTLHFARHGEEAETVYRRVLAAEPDRPRVNAFLALVIYLRGTPEPARAIAARERLRYSRLTALAIIDRALGKREAAAASLKELSDTYGDKAATQYAQIYAQWGQPDQAFQWLDRGLKMRDPGILLAKVDPMLEPLHPDPRWRVFLNNLGLGDSGD